MRFTNRNIERLKPQNKLTDYRDPAYSNLELRVTPRGTKTFCLVYTSPSNSKRTRLKLGRRTSEGSLRALLTKYRQGYTAIHVGEDPAEEKRQAKRAQRAVPTLRACGEDYVEHMRLNRAEGTYKQARMYFSKYIIPAWRDRPITDISRQDVMRLLYGLQQNGMTTGVNGVFSHLRSFFNRLRDREVIQVAPTDHLRKPVKDRKSTRFLETTELGQFLDAVARAAVSNETKNALELYLLTGARRDEIADMTWQEINFEDRLWCLPAERTKARKARTIPLCTRAVAILKAQRDRGSVPRVFGIAANTLNRHIVKIRREELPKMPRFTIHSLRHTVISHLARLGTPREVIQALVGHTHVARQSNLAVRRHPDLRTPSS